MENAKSKKLRKAIFALLWTDAAILLPCFISSIGKILRLLAKTDIFSGSLPEIAAILLAVAMIAFVLSRCFFLPEIMFAAALILQIAYFVIERKSNSSESNERKRTAILCAILDIFCIVALFSAQSVFDAAMSV